MKNNNTKHSQYKHGMFGTRPYRIWSGMLNRCRNKKTINYKTYGSRGIKVCKRWNKFEKFWLDMEAGYADNLSIDRIDNDGDYCPQNCRWATAKQQSENKGNVPIYILRGKVVTRPELALYFGVKIDTLRARMRRGWTIQDAIKPVDNDTKFRRDKICVKEIIEDDK